MSIPLSIDDTFTTGVSFDLLGGYLLGRGLLAGPQSIARRTYQTTTWDHHFNAAEAITHIHAEADAKAGLLSLATGFLLQAGGYVALVAGAEVSTSLGRAGASVLLALVAAGAAFLVFRRVRRALIKRSIVQVARANPLTGQMDELPDEQTFIELAQALGLTVVEVASGVVRVSDAAKSMFGIEGFSRRRPASLPPVSRR